MSEPDIRNLPSGAENAPEVLPHHRVRRRRKRSRWLRRITHPFGFKLNWLNFLIIVVTVIVIAVVLGVALISSGINNVETSILSLTRLVTSLEQKPSEELTLEDFQRLQVGVAELAGNLSQAQRQLGLLRPLVEFNQDLSTRFTSLQAAYYLSLAAQEILTGLQPTLFFMSSGEESGVVAAQISSGERIVELLRLGQSQFASAERLLVAAQEQIGSANIASLASDQLLDFQTLQRYLDQLTNVNQILLAGPDLLTTALGLSGESSYLILSQNSDELRPSGGFISTYGWMVVSDGRIVDYDYGPVTPTDPNPPPESLSNPNQSASMMINSAFERSAWLGGWYADFPTTAEMGMWFYDNGNNPQSPVDGVLAIDIVGFERILGALGSVTVPEYGEVVSSDNFRDVIYDIRATGEGDLPHKRFLAALYRQIITDWQNADGDPQENAALMGAMLHSLSEKHIQMYFADDQLNQAVSLLGWSGAQAPATDHDYLMMADANLRNKSNHSITRQLTYDVDIQADGSLLSRATISYDYPARIAGRDPAVNANYHGPLDYTNVLQLFVPLGSEVTGGNTTGAAAQLIESGSHSVFIGSFTVPYDSSERVQFMYETPPLVTTFGRYNQYRLLLQKQPGTLAESASIQVALPQGSRIVSVSPEPVASYNLEHAVLEFRLSLTTDQWIEIIYSN